MKYVKMSMPVEVWSELHNALMAGGKNKTAECIPELLRGHRHDVSVNFEGLIAPSIDWTLDPVFLPIPVRHAMIMVKHIGSCLSKQCFDSTLIGGGIDMEEAVSLMYCASEDNLDASDEDAEYFAREIEDAGGIVIEMTRKVIMG